jgi:transcriptional regulator with GAF, ATPase, and Fis domain
MASVWYRSTSGDWPPPPRLRELARHFESFDPLGDRPPAGPGLLFVRDLADPVADFLAKAGALSAPVVAIMAPGVLNGDTETVWTLLRVGARDVLGWGEVRTLGPTLAERFRRWSRVDAILDTSLVRGNLVGQSAHWHHLLQEVVDLALFSSASLLITGETGTGKELLARLVHTLDPRPDKGRLVTLDCSTIVPDLSGSEFFGHERGSFTGAHQSREGAFALAHRGTLFLDEVGELPPALQAQLLRVVQDRTYKPVGGNEWRSTDFRLICATNKDLEAERDQGRFRADFYHRVAVCRVHVAPLSVRREDILPLAHHFLGLELGQDPGPDDTVARFLLARDYPGNVRELRQLVRRIAARHTGSGLISPGDIPSAERPAGAAPSVGHDQTLEAWVRAAVLRGDRLRDIARAAEQLAERVALEQEHGNLQRAARRLGLTGRALQMRRAARRRNGPVP